MSRVMEVNQENRELYIYKILILIKWKLVFKWNKRMVTQEKKEKKVKMVEMLMEK